MDLSETAVYRMYSGDELLYVGISGSPMYRFSQHSVSKKWAHRVTKVTIEWMETRELAAAEEAIAIHRELPSQNVMLKFTPKKTPVASGQMPKSLVAGIIREIGRDRVKAIMKVQDRTINMVSQHGIMPASWFAFCEEELGRELPREIFNFKPDLTNGVWPPTT